jgi:DNA-binding beta-propeller fold protein YncE
MRKRSATPASAAGTDSGAAPVSVKIPVRYAARNAPRIYLSGGPGQNWIKVYDEYGNPLTGLSGTFPNLSGPTGLGYDRAGNRVFAANYSNGTVTAYTPDGAQVPLATPITGTNPTAVAYDSSADRIYVATHDLGLFVYDPSGNAVDSFSSDNGGAGLAQDPLSDRLFASWTAHAVTVYDGDSHAIVPVPGSWPRTAQPNAIAFDPANGLLYVHDTDAQAFGYADNVTVYDPNGNPVATPGTFAGAENGWGMTIVP